jgi:hypothetical protein
MIECYEIPNTFTPEMPLDEQIEQGCNDWRCDLPNGIVFFGRTKEEALSQARSFVSGMNDGPYQHENGWTA